MRADENSQVEGATQQQWSAAETQGVGRDKAQAAAVSTFSMESIRSGCGIC